MTIPPLPLMRADDLLTLPDDDMQHELVRGVHCVIPPPGARHGRIGVRIAMLLEHHAMAHALGVVLVETGFVLARDPDTVRAPDVSFVRQGRVPESGVPDGYFEGAPDLAVEVLSPTDAPRDVDEKVAEYLEAGGRLVWVVNPHRRTVAIHATGRASVVLEESDALDGGDVLPGLRARVRDMMGRPA